MPVNQARGSTPANADTPDRARAPRGTLREGSGTTVVRLLLEVRDPLVAACRGKVWWCVCVGGGGEGGEGGEGGDRTRARHEGGVLRGGLQAPRRHKHKAPFTAT
jgi:hypothetical protein